MAGEGRRTDEEVEVSLSLRNTIPNASAVLFRRPHRLDFAEELLNLRFAGDWLFYAMRIRGGAPAAAGAGGPVGAIARGK